MQKIIRLLFYCLLIPAGLLSQSEDSTKTYTGKPVTVTADKYKWLQEQSRMAAKMLIPLQRTPLSVTVINQKILEEQKAVHLTDALKNASGIHIEQNMGTQDYYLIRGFESTTSGLLLTDGLSESGASMFQYYGFGLNDLYNIAQVEVLKGPAAFLYGGNTHSGAVNLVRKQPLFQNFLQITSFQRTDRAIRETVDLNYSAGPRLALRLNSLWEHTRNFRQKNGNLRFAVNPSLLWRIDPYNYLKINLEFLHNDISPDFGIPLYIPEKKWQRPDVPGTTNYQSPFDKIDFDLFRFRADFERQLQYAIRLNNYTSFTYVEGSSRLTLPHIPERNRFGQWIVNRHIANVDERQLRLRNQFELQRDFQLKTIRQKVLLGIEIGYLKNFSGEQSTLMDFVYLFHPQNKVKKFADLLTLQNRAETNARQWMAASYLVDYVELSERVQVFLGGRFDYQDFSTDRLNAPFDYLGRAITSQPVAYSDQTAKFSPMLGMVWQESENLWFYFNYGQAFGQGKRLIDSPETSTQYEFGYKYKTANNKIMTSAVFYSLRRENISIPLQGPLQGGLHASTGIQRSQGLEFELVAQPISGSYVSLFHTFTDAELIEFKTLTVDEYVKLTVGDFSGNQPAFVPAQITQVWLHQTFTAKLKMGVGLSLVSPQYVSPDNQYDLPGYTTWNAQMTYRFGQVEISLDLRNLTNKNYLNRGFGAYSVIPAEPRGIYVVTQLAF